jgi:hypothetical protein
MRTGVVGEGVAITHGVVGAVGGGKELPQPDQRTARHKIRQEPAALRDFTPTYAACGSFATEAVEATRACMSAFA